MEELLAQAKRLGERLADTEAMKAYKAAEAFVQADGQSKDIIGDLEKIREEFVRASRDKAPESFLDTLREQYLKRQQEFETYEPTLRYVEAKSKFDDIVKKVNGMIQFGMTGEMPCSDESCASCQGGCKK